MKLRRRRSAFRGTARVTALDGTIWGGEFFLVTDENVERVAHLRPFRLPGGDKAVKEPRRTALGLLYEIFGDAVFEQNRPGAGGCLFHNGTGRLENDAGEKIEFAGDLQHGPVV